MSSHKLRRSYVQLTLPILFGAALLMTGCGGGGGGGGGGSAGGGTSGGETPPSANAIDLQGIWLSVSANTSTSTIILPDSTLWTVVSDGSSTRIIVAKLSLKDTTFTGNGKTYVLGASDSTANSITLSGSPKNVITEEVVTGNQRSTLIQAYQSRYDTPAVLADFSNVWTASLGVGKITWTVSASGALTGTSTTGCSYGGQVSERSERKAVVDINVTETCSGSTTRLRGVATLSADKSRWNVVTTTEDSSSALLLSLSK